MPVVPQFFGIVYLFPGSNDWSMNRLFQSALTKPGILA